MPIDVGKQHKATGIGMSDFIKIFSTLIISSLLALNLMVVRPLKERLTSMESQMSAVGGRMEMLVAERDQARSTADLLTILRSQRATIEESYAALKSIRQFREEVAAESERATEMLPALQRLVELENLMIQQRQLAEPAAQSLEEIASMQRLLADQVHNVHEAGRVLSRMADTQRSLLDIACDAESAEIGLERLTELKRRVLSQTRSVDEARRRLDDVANFAQAVIQEADDLPAAQNAVDALLALKEMLVVRGSGVHASQQIARNLLMLRDTLAARPMDTEVAAQNLDLLLEMRERLANIERESIVTKRPAAGFTMQQIMTAVIVRMRAVDTNRLIMTMLDKKILLERISQTISLKLRDLNIRPQQWLEMASLQYPMANVARSVAAVMYPQTFEHARRPMYREASRRNEHEAAARKIDGKRASSNRPLEPTPARRVFWPMED